MSEVAVWTQPTKEVGNSIFNVSMIHSSLAQLEVAQ
jgi:hypothetical protein